MIIPGMPKLNDRIGVDDWKYYMVISGPKILSHIDKILLFEYNYMRGILFSGSVKYFQRVNLKF